jgi:hypothetical protein
MGKSETRKGQQNLYVSNDNATSFKEAMFPNRVNVPFLFPEQLLDDRGAIWLAVKSTPEWWGVYPGNVYVADTSGYRYT